MTHPTIPAVSGRHMPSTHLDFCRKGISISTTWGSITRVCRLTLKERAESRGRQSEHDCGEPPSIGITTTSSRFNQVGTVQATSEPGRFRLNTAIVWSKRL